MRPSYAIVFLTGIGLIAGSAACAPDHSPSGTVVYFALLLAGLSLGSWALITRKD